MDFIVTITILFILLIIIILVEWLIIPPKHDIISSISSRPKRKKKSQYRFQKEKPLCPKCKFSNKISITSSLFPWIYGDRVEYYYCNNGHFFHTDEKSLIGIGLHSESDISAAIDVIDKYYKGNVVFETRMKQLHDEIKERVTQEYEKAVTFECKNNTCPICHGVVRVCTSALENSIYQCEKLHTWHLTSKGCKLGRSLSVQIHSNIKDAKAKLLTPSLIKKLQDGVIPAVDELFP